MTNTKTATFYINMIFLLSFVSWSKYSTLSLLITGRLGCQTYQDSRERTYAECVAGLAGEAMGSGGSLAMTVVAGD